MSRAWILLRGLARGQGHWGDFPQKLQAAFPDDQFELLDVPGNGLLFTEKSPMSVTAMVEALREQSHLLETHAEVQILALSLGGMIATEWARNYPREVKAMFLANTSAANYAHFYERLQPRNYRKLLSQVGASAERKEKNVLEMISNSPEGRARTLPMWVKEAIAHPTSAGNFARQLWAAGTFRFPAQAPTKAYLLASEKDQFVSVQCSKNLAAAWNCPLELHPWAGHDIPVDDPEWMLKCLKKLQEP